MDCTPDLWFTGLCSVLGKPIERPCSARRLSLSCASGYSGAMNAMPHSGGARDWRRPLRYAVRVPLAVLMLLLALPAALLQNGWAARRRVHGEPLDQRVVRWWTRTALRMIGIRVRKFGTALPDPAMFVANHCSWLDIVVVHTQRAVCFVAKAEIERWPLFGFLAASAGTIFHRRGSTDSLARVMQVMVERMLAGRSVAVFPEGGAAHGATLKIFHARIFQAALDADAPIQPVALRYSRGGINQPQIAFAPGENFIGNVWRLLGDPPLQAEVHFLAPLERRDGGRKQLAQNARAQIAQALDAA